MKDSTVLMVGAYIFGFLEKVPPEVQTLSLIFGSILAILKSIEIILNLRDRYKKKQN